MTILSKQTASPADAFHAAQQTALLVARPGLGMLKVTGKTRLDLIHRMSTQDVATLQPGEGAATVLTTDIGRIIDRLILYAASDALYVLTGEENALAIGRYLLGFVFWGDDFKLEDLTTRTSIFGVYGPQAQSRLQAAGFADVDVARHHWRTAQLGSATAYVHRTDPIGGDGYFVTCTIAAAPTVAERLLAAGLVPGDEDAFDYARIAAGQPRFGRELTQEYIPLEADLWADVSFNKGCYTGQEIIARMESRGQLAKKLTQLRSAAPLAAGMELRAGGKRAGVVTSAADGPAGPVALGYVRTAALKADAEFSAGDVPVTLLP